MNPTAEFQSSENRLGAMAIGTLLTPFSASDAMREIGITERCVICRGPDCE